MTDFFDYLLCEIATDAQKEAAWAYHSKVRKRRTSRLASLLNVRGKRVKKRVKNARSHNGTHGEMHAFPVLPEHRFAP